MPRPGSVVTLLLAMALLAPVVTARDSALAAWIRVKNQVACRLSLSAAQGRDWSGCTSLPGTRGGSDAPVLPPRSRCP